MDLRHEFVVPLTVPDAWVAFNDLERIAPCFPGAAITSTDGDDFTGTAKVKLGPVSLQYSGKGSFVSRDETAHTAVIEAAGTDKRGNGTAAATITASLHEVDAATTRVVVETDLKITGRPAQFGRGMISDVGGKILNQFAACLAENLAVDPADAAAAEPAADLAAEPAASSEGAASEGASAADSADGPAAAVATAVAGPASSTAGPGASSAGASSAGASGGGPRLRAVAPAEAELDLGSVLGPVIAKKALPVVAALLLIAWLWRRRG